MKRRTFLKRTAPALALPWALNGMRFRAMAQTSGLSRILSSIDPSDRVLVVVQLIGGNDGLNTVIPVDDPIYYNSRPTIGIPKDSALALHNEPLLRFHPAMSGMRDMFNDGRMAIVSNIGYADYSLSHFSGTEIWNTGPLSSISEQLGTGWLGRFLEGDFPEYPSLLPDDPPAIQIRASTSSIFNAGSSTMAMALTDPVAFHDLVQGSPDITDDEAPDTLPGREWRYVRTMDTQAVEYAETIRRAASKAKNIAQYPAGQHAEALAIVARLIAGGLKTRVYMVSFDNFDTHGNQLTHHNFMLDQLSGALKAFSDDTIALGIDHRVVGMTYSEFGRRIAQNATGTDHGAAAPHFVFGTPVDGGRIYGGLPDLANPDPNGNLAHERTFQCYYASVLGPLFDIPENRMGRILPFGICGTDERVGLYHSNFVRVPEDRAIDAAGVRSFPNPASNRVTLAYTLLVGGRVEVAIHDVEGRLIKTVVKDFQGRGEQQLELDLRSLPSGSYICELRRGDDRSSTRIVVAR